MSVIEITVDMEAIIKQAILSFVATVNEDGTPNLSPKASLTIRNGILYFADIASPQTVANLKRNPAIEINVVDIFQRRGYRFKGRALVLSPGSDDYSMITNWVRATNGREYPVDHVVKIEIASTSPLMVPAFSFAAPCWSQEPLLSKVRHETHHQDITAEPAKIQDQAAAYNSGATIQIPGAFHVISTDQSH